MSDHAEHDIKKDVRIYMIVFGVLIIGTVLTVLASYIHIGHPDSNVGNIILALVIAGAKGSLVAGYFMHLFSEKTLIYTVLGFTVFFFIGMMFLTVYANYDVPMVESGN